MRKLLASIGDQVMMLPEGGTKMQAKAHLIVLTMFLEMPKDFAGVKNCLKS